MKKIRKEEPFYFHYSSPAYLKLLDENRVAEVQWPGGAMIRVYLYEDEEENLFSEELLKKGYEVVEAVEPVCPFTFMNAQRQPELFPPSEKTLALWRAISFHGG